MVGLSRDNTGGLLVGIPKSISIGVSIRRSTGLMIAVLLLLGLEAGGDIAVLGVMGLATRSSRC